jgi:hypothetical protein
MFDRQIPFVPDISIFILARAERDGALGLSQDLLKNLFDRVRRDAKIKKPPTRYCRPARAVEPL